MYCWDSKAHGKNNKYRKSVFDKKEIDSLNRKFNYVSGNQQFITRETFKKNIGYLGIRAVDSFLDRIFNSFDIDEDGKISFDDFFQYMEILKDGTDDQKANISFNLIYMDKQQEEEKRRSKQQKSKISQDKKKAKRHKKQIDLPMFQRFFEQFYKSWSSITSQSIPKDTKITLRIFLQELYAKVNEDGRNTIDLEYYKMLYKDRQFMMAFRQINNKLGNLFIKSANDSKKHLTLMHNVLKQINLIYSKSFPLLNDKFSESTPQSKSSGEFDRYNYDAQRYKSENAFGNGNIAEKQDILGFNNQAMGHAIQGQQFSLKKFLELNKPKAQSEVNGNAYEKKLQTHVKFLQHKLFYIEQKLKQVIEESKDMYEQMHQQFLKILDRIERQREQDDQQFLNRQNKEKTKKSKENKKVFFGDKNFNLVLEIMVGIQMSVRSVSGFQEVIYEEPEDFHLKHTFQMDTGRFGQNDTMYTFTDYAPNVFNHIRKLYEIDNENYINSIGPNKMMSALVLGKMASFQELVSEGKSGSFFYHTQDGIYLIKTISQKQFYFMRKILQSYFRHLKTNPQTLMPRFFGLHKLTSVSKDSYSKNVYYLIVMNNFFNTKDKITDKYDLKGSWVGRQNTSGVGVKKDINFQKEGRILNIDQSMKQKLTKIIKKDSKFFSENNILDYSVLIGIVESQKPNSHQRHLQQSQITSLIQKPNSQTCDPNNPMNFKIHSCNKNEYYLIGIIDILTQYNSKKQAEHLFKSCVYDGQGISAIPPLNYEKRFLQFIEKDVFRLQGKSNYRSPGNKVIQKKDIKRNKQESVFSKMYQKK